MRDKQIDYKAKICSCQNQGYSYSTHSAGQRGQASGKKPKNQQRNKTCGKILQQHTARKQIAENGCGQFYPC